MIDIHCHLLPGIDDGPKSWDESIQMARMAAADGITGTVTTPHWIQGTSWQPEPATVRSMVDEMNSRLAAEGIDFTVYPGMEIGIIPDLPKVFSEGRLLSLAEGDFILIEIPFYTLPLGIEEVIFGLKMQGLKPVLAHPERNREFQGAPKRIMDFLKLGALVQVTAGSLCGGFGESAKKCSIEFAKLGAIHFVASDAHSTKHRTPVVSDAFSALRKTISAEQAGAIASNTFEIIKGRSQGIKAGAGKG